MHGLQTAVSSPFAAASTARDVIDGIDLSGRLAIVTGGYSGIGLETTKAFVAAGATVIVPGAQRQKGTRGAARPRCRPHHAPRPCRPGLDRRVCRERPRAARRHRPAHQQRRLHRFRPAAGFTRLRSPVRHKPPRPFPVDRPPLVRARGGKGSSGHCLLLWPCCRRR